MSGRVEAASLIKRIVASATSVTGAGAPSPAGPIVVRSGQKTRATMCHKRVLRRSMRRSGDRNEFKLNGGAGHLNCSEMVWLY